MCVVLAIDGRGDGDAEALMCPRVGRPQEMVPRASVDR